MNLAWSERDEASLTSLSDYKTPGMKGRSGAANSSPNETDVPSVRKSRGQLPPLDAKDYIKSMAACTPYGCVNSAHPSRCFGTHGRRVLPC